MTTTWLRGPCQRQATAHRADAAERTVWPTAAPHPNRPLLDFRYHLKEFCFPAFFISSMFSRCLLLTAAAVRGAQVISAFDPHFVRPLGRVFPSAGGLGLSWLGGGLHVSHTGSVLRATVLAHPSRPFKFATYESTQGNDPWQGVVIIPASTANESFVASAGGAGEVKIVLNVPPDYWASGADAVVILSLESDGAFNPAPPAPSRVLHVLGDSITAATNVRGGFPRCADGGLYADYSSSWAGILCAFFGASCSTVAVGGKGLVKNCCDASTTVPEYYTQTKKNDPDHTFGFTDAPPAGILVYLGTNVSYARHLARCKAHLTPTTPRAPPNWPRRTTLEAAPPRWTHNSPRRSFRLW